MTQTLIGCDLFLDLAMFRVPDHVVENIHSKFPQVKIVPINCPSEREQPSDIEIYWGNRITSKTLEAQKNLRWIHFGSVGTNRVSSNPSLRDDVIVSNSKGQVTGAMVATALGFICTLARGLHHANLLRQKNEFTRESFDSYFDKLSDLEGKKALIVGMGDIGTRLASMLECLSMQVEGIRRSKSSKSSENRVIGTLEDLENMASTADFVINLLPLAPATERVFTERVFSAMKRSSFFVNLGRGESVDESALLRALRENSIAGAALDVFVEEPLRPGSEFFDLENVMITPHVAGASSSYWQRQEELFIYNLQMYLDGRLHDMRNLVTPGRH